MEVDIQTLFGIAASVFLFLLSYRQTVGAKKERVGIANNEIQQTIVKRIILESYTPNVAELSRLIDGKARDHRVKGNDLMSINQILNTVFTRIIESDLIVSDQRKIFLEQLNPILVAVEESPIKETEVMEIESTTGLKYQRMSPLLFAIIASIIGALLSTFPYSQEETFSLLSNEIIGVFILIISIIALILILFKFKESQEEPSKSSLFEKSFDFEKEVGKFIEKLEVLKPYPSHNHRYESGYDYYIEIKGEGIIIEVKYWSKSVPSKILQLTIDRLQRVLKSKENVGKAIIVTKNSIYCPSDVLQDEHIDIMSFKEFKNYLSSEK